MIERLVEEAGKPYFDWLKCKVQVFVPFFSGSFEWYVTPHELSVLADELARLYDQFPKLGNVIFEPIEPNVTFKLKILSTGVIPGNYEFRGDLAEGGILKGQFKIDQSYLPGLVNDIRTFLQSAN